MKALNLITVSVVLYVALAAKPAAADLMRWSESWENGKNTANWNYIHENGRTYLHEWGIVTTATIPDIPDGDQCLQYSRVGVKSVTRSIGSTLKPTFITYYYRGENAGGHDSNDKNSFFVLDDVPYSPTNTNPGNLIRIRHTNAPDPNEVRVTAGDDHAGGSTRVLPQKTWHKITLEIDPRPGVRTFDWYVDDVLVDAGLSFMDSGGAGEARGEVPLGHVRLFAADWTGDGSAAGNGPLTLGWIDAIDVAPEPPTQCGDPHTDYLPGDISGPNGVRDCVVDEHDLMALATDWLLCADAGNPACDAYWNNAYNLYRGGESQPIDPNGLELTLGSDEFESVEITVEALLNVSGLLATISGLPAGAVEIGLQNGISNPGTQYVDDMKYGIDYDSASPTQRTMTIGAGDQQSFWLTFNTNNMSVGDHSFDLDLTPTLGPGPTRSVPILLHVLDVQRPDPNDAHMQMYHNLTYLENSPGEPGVLFDMMQSHYVNQIQLHFGFAAWANALVVTRDPALSVDFTGFDAKFQKAIDAGFTDVAIMGSLFRDSWFAATDSNETPEEQLETRREVVGLLIDHIDSLINPGVSDLIWNYTLDEQPVSVWLDQATLDDMAWRKSTHPNLRIHITVAHYSEGSAAGMNPYLDVWTAQYRIIQTLLEDIENATLTIDPNDEVGTYAGGSWTNSTDLMRGRGWVAGFHDVQFFNIFAFHQDGGNAQSDTWRMWVPGPGGDPVTTSAFEGLRDGFEDFGYWRAFSLLLAQAEAASPGAQAVLDAQAFKDAVFDTTTPANGLVPMEIVGGAGGGRDWLNIINHDRWNYLDVREQLFGHIGALKTLLGI